MRWRMRCNWRGHQQRRGPGRFWWARAGIEGIYVTDPGFRLAQIRGIEEEAQILDRFYHAKYLQIELSVGLLKEKSVSKLGIFKIQIYLSIKL